MQVVPPALKLAASQLADVLAHVSPKDRMHSCAVVCKAFYMASVLATRRVVLEDSYARDSYTVGCKWLQMHGQAVGVTSLSFKSRDHREFSEQQIWDQLATLQQLEFTYIRIPPLPAAVLTSLTYLHCENCCDSVDSLPDLTQLQHLALLAGSYASDESRSRQVSVLQQALPHLRALTHLSLSHQLTRDAALQALQELPCLQELLLHVSDSTAATFEVLPASLTRLEIECAFWQQEELKLRLGLNSAAAVQRLTGLQHMKLHNVPAVHPELLAALTGLQQLEVTSSVLAAGPREAGWSVLGHLTNLQRLNLWRTTSGTDPHTAPQLTAADVAALTASSQLSYLNLSSRMVQGDHLTQLLPEGKQLHGLQELYIAVDLLADFSVPLETRFPNLHVLELSQAASGANILDTYDYELAECFHALAHLRQLTSLKINFSKLAPGRNTWDALGYLGGLRSLGLSGVDWQSAHGMLELTTCRQLTQLEVTAEAPEWAEPTYREETIVSVVNQVRPKSTALQQKAFASNNLAAPAQHGLGVLQWHLVQPVIGTAGDLLAGSN